MVTKVGMQDEYADALKDLLELECDALEAYEAAIKRLEDENYKQKMLEFSQDHKRHIKEISEVLNAHNITYTPGPSAKQWLTKGKVILANLMGDKKILDAMLSNEVDTNAAYERMQARVDIWDGSRSIIIRGLVDEKRHKSWLETVA
jgi:ferritin-like metal-binding protein YciE